MNMVRVHPLGGPELRVEYHAMEVSTWNHTEPDSTWRFIDAAGHGHFYDDGYPTLREITETVLGDYEGEEWEAHVGWECPHCGETIEPPTRLTTNTRQGPGLKRYMIDGITVPREEFVEAYKRLMERKLADELETL